MRKKDDFKISSMSHELEPAKRIHNKNKTNSFSLIHLKRNITSKVEVAPEALQFIRRTML